jgi:hypothetical protein
VSIRWWTALLAAPVDRFEVDRHFWAAVTAMTAWVDADPQGFTTLVPSTGDAYLAMLPAGAESGGCRLMVHVDDPAAVCKKAAGLGGRVQHHGPAATWMRSPAGLLFGITAWRDASHRPPPASWPAGQRSLVDQVCLDIPPAAFDIECDFWAALTGSEHRAGSRPEFRYLPRPTGMPLRLLLQRLDDPAAGAAGAHLDLACSDVGAEIRRHEALGAAVVYEGPVWTTLRDPAGIGYCVTGRDPDTGTLPSPRP